MKIIREVTASSLGATMSSAAAVSRDPILFLFSLVIYCERWFYKIQWHGPVLVVRECSTFMTCPGLILHFACCCALVKVLAWLGATPEALL